MGGGVNKFAPIPPIHFIKIIHYMIYYAKNQTV